MAHHSTLRKGETVRANEHNENDFDTTINAHNKIQQKRIRRWKMIRRKGGEESEEKVTKYKIHENAQCQRNTVWNRIQSNKNKTK